METSDSGDLPDDGNQSAASTERRRKRDSRNCINSPSLDPENETSGSSKLRKTHPPLTHSDPPLTNSDPPLANMDPPLTHSDYTTVDESESDSSSSGEGEVSDSVSTWEYKELLDLNICYSEKLEPIENFIQEVKDAFRNRKGFCPDCSDLSRSLKRQLEECLTFSYDLRKMRDLAYTSLDYREDELQKVNREMEETVKKAWRNAELSEEQGLDSSVTSYTQSQVNGMVLAVREFAVETSQLTRKTLFTEAKSEEKGRKRQRAGSQGQRAGSQGCGDTECVTHPDNFFQNYFEVFGRMFSLKKGEIPQRSFTFRDHSVRNSPDLVYHFFSKGKSMEELFFLMEIKESPVKHGAVAIEEQVGTRELALAGGELLGQSMCSVLYPCSLGILCMETKLMFVFLKISLKHSISIRKGERGSSDNPGTVMYTEAFDILKAEDRLKMADFLFWLGCVQDYGKYKLF